MTAIDKTDPSQTAAISFEFDLRHRPEKVWRALTTPALLTEWLLPIVALQLEPGASFQFQAPAYPGWDGVVNCRILAIDAPHTLSYTWAAIGLDTVVTFTLTPTADGTRLSLVQSGFLPEQKQNFGGARYGWNLMGGKLLNVLAQLA